MSAREHLEVTLPSGMTVGLAEYGDPDGLPMLFFHGWPSSRIQARLCDAAARDRKIRLIAMDRPGIGVSTYAPNRRLKDWPAFVTELTDHLGIERFSILAVSGGGPYALVTTLAMSERLDAVGIVCGAPPLAMFKDKRDLHPAYRVIHTVRRFAPWAMPPFLPLARAFAKLPPYRLLTRLLSLGISGADRAAIADPIAHRAVTASFIDASVNGMKPMITDGDIYFEDWEFRIEDIDFPIQFWHGERDRNIPCRMAQEIAKSIPQATGKWFANEGHYSLPIFRIGEILDDLVTQGKIAVQACRASSSNFVELSGQSDSPR